MPPAYIRYLFSRNLEGKELTDEKIRDFKRIVLAQTILILELLLFYFFEFLGFPYYLEIAETIFLSTVGVYCFFLWDTLRNYTTNRRIIRGNFIFIMGVFVFGFIGVNPFFPMEPTTGYRTFLIVVMACLLTVEVSVIYFTIVEFFRKDWAFPSSFGVPPRFT